MLGYLEFSSGRTMPLTWGACIKLGREHTAAKSLHVSKSAPHIPYFFILLQSSHLDHNFCIHVSFAVLWDVSHLRHYYCTYPARLTSFPPNSLAVFATFDRSAMVCVQAPQCEAQRVTRLRICLVRHVRHGTWLFRCLKLTRRAFRKAVVRFRAGEGSCWASAVSI